MADVLTPEMRKQQRFKAKEGALALADENMAKIIDIGRGGVSLLFFDNSLQKIPERLFLDLLSIESEMKADQLPGQLTWEQEVSFSPVAGMVYKKVGIQFGNLSLQQTDQLDALILHYSDELSDYMR
ncbi:MAG: hypothetical protein PHI06_01445 [Desulfobulbaceae bacterium]|nr:hypothetical protein [Desulfobulbaceae bacterium]